MTRYAITDTPLGRLLAVSGDAGLRSLAFLDDDRADPLGACLDSEGRRGSLESPGAFEPLFTLLATYFRTGRLIATDSVELDLEGTPFQQGVWEALRAIPDGEVLSYAVLARSLGLAPGCARAVGAACAANPVAILIPCHRVVPAHGGHGGYRWGIDRKRALLDLERRPRLIPLRDP